MSSIPIADPELGAAEREGVREILEDGQIADGPEVRRFEEEFAAVCECENGIATSNGTTALETALRALGIGEGDTVVTTPFSFVATANAIRHCGATPVFADVDPDTYNLDPDAVEAVIRERDGDVDGVLAVHLYGLPAEMDRLSEIADRHGIPLVEDAAQAHGAEYDGRPVGSLGDAAAFSFYPTKNMTTGEGGMVVTDHDEVAERARRYIDHGRGKTTGDGYVHVTVGHNYRMTSLAAAIGRAQLERLPAFNRARREHAQTLTAALADVPGVEPPAEPADRRHVYHQYTVRCDDRERLRDRLDAAGVGSSVYYPRAIHEQPAYASVETSLPVAERATEEVLSLPVHPALEPDDLRTITETLQAASAEGIVDD